MAMAAEPGGAGAARYQAYDRQREMAAWSQSDCDAALKEKSRQSQGQIHRRAKPCGRALGILRVQIAIPRDRNGPEKTMTQIQAIGRDAASPVSRFIAFLYGACSLRRVLRHHSLRHRLRLAACVVPKTIDTGTVVPIAEALIVNLLLMSVFAIQHSVMARKQFKQWWTQFVPKSVERSTYVLFSSLALMLLFWQWRPMPAVVWQIDDPQVAVAVTGAVVRRLADRVHQHVPDQPFRAVRTASGRQQSHRPPDAGAALPHAALLQVRAAPDLSRLHHRVLGGADDDGRSSAVRGGDHGLHLRRHPAGRARPDRSLRRRVPPLQGTVSMLVPWRKSA